MDGLGRRLYARELAFLIIFLGIILSSVGGDMYISGIFTTLKNKSEFRGIFAS